MIEVSEEAKETIRQLIARADLPNGGLRIAAVRGTCAGVQYRLSLDRTADAGDRVLEAGGARIFLDPETAATHARLAIDFVADAGEPGFLLDATATGAACACGSASRR